MRPSKEEITDLSREQIAEKFGVCLRTAVRWQKHYDLFQPKIGRLNQAEADMIRANYEKGWSVQDCVVAYGRSLTTIYRVINNQIYPSTKDTANVSVNYNPNH